MSSLVCFHLFVRPALAMLAERSDSLDLPLKQGRVEGDYTHRGGRETFRPARRAPDGQIEMIDWRGSADLAGAAAADCLVRLPQEAVSLTAGDPVDYLPLDGP